MIETIQKVIGYAVLLPFVYIFIDYGFVRTFVKRPDGQRKYDPFWLTGVGWMFFLISVTMTCTAIRAYLRLFFDDTHLWMQVIAGVTYVVGLASAVLLVLVYLLEKRSVGFVMAPKDVRRDQRQYLKDLEDSKNRAQMEAARHAAGIKLKRPRTGPVDTQPPTR
jgi:hypothetical protein